LFACLQVDCHVDRLALRITKQSQLKVARQLTKKGLQPRQLLLASCAPGAGSRAAATQLLVSEEFRPLLARVRDLTLTDEKGLTEEMLQVRHCELSPWLQLMAQFDSFLDGTLLPAHVPLTV
jgi:hypothetical protein